MNIPLEKKLRKRAHVELASLQDEVVDVLFSISDSTELVLHGGTALWRCYGGVRFSEDLDFYGSFKDDFKEKLSIELERRGLTLLKFKKAPNVIYSKITNNQTIVKLEITRSKPPGKVLRGYEKVDGSYIDVHTLSPQDLIREKIGAYMARRYIRDIYDVCFLSSLIEGDVPEVADSLDRLPKPIDEENLKVLVYSGVAPTFKEMVDKLRRRFR